MLKLQFKKVKPVLFSGILILSISIFACNGNTGGNTYNDTEKTVTIFEIPGIVVPVRGSAPVITPIDTTQYTGVITWSPDDNPFASTKVYSANIVLSAKEGFTFTGISENFSL